MRLTSAKLSNLSHLLCGGWLIAASLLVFPQPGHAAGDSFAESLRGDAAIRDIQFVDSQSGWAVGENAAIWHTSDGGTKWQLQSVPIRCQLHAVSGIARKLYRDFFPDSRLCIH